ncbi:hypothetical protein DFH09DRAFT_1169582, partial [Mycena vulgaris]
MLVDAYPVCGLGVSVATDGMYQTEVFAALHSPCGALARGVVPRRGRDRLVLLLLGIRLGLDGMNPFYHETIEMLYTFPQSVGIADGRPSPSYYFVGAQGNGLVYLDPHHSLPFRLCAYGVVEPRLCARGINESRVQARARARAHAHDGGRA